MKKKDIDLLLNEFKNNKKPIMLYNLVQLEKNIKLVLKFQKKYNLKFIFPIKAFPHEKVIKIFAKNDFGFDIANENEYNFVKKYIKKDTFVSINGIMGKACKIDCENVIYNLNSIYDLDFFDCYNGIRINTYLNKKNKFSRFGIPIYDLNNNRLVTEQIKSFSFHFYEDNKEKKIKLICKLYKNSISKFSNIKYINIGGNWNILEINEFEKNLIKLRKVIDKEIKIIIEVGENWFNNCGFLLTNVVSQNQIFNKKIFYINAVKDSVAKWSVLKPINLNYDNNKDKYTYVISGNSCYEKDVFYVSTKKIDLKVNDMVIFKGLNGYSYAWSKEFNGSEKPEVVFYE